MIIRNFMFHDVRDINPDFYPKRYELKSFLSIEKFKKIIDLIINEYEVMDTKLISNTKYQKDKKYATLTFDDGLLDHYYVFKYLKEKNIPATFFIPTLPITDNKIIHSHKIQFIIASTKENIIKNEILLTTNDKESVFEKFSKTAWKDNWWSKDMIFITNFLRKVDFIDKYEYVDFLFKKYVNKDMEYFSKQIYLDKEKIKEMANSNLMTIGGHGDTSENLLLVNNYDSEINNTANFLKEYTNFLSFSYPNGGFNNQIKDCLIKNGFKQSFTINPITLTDFDINTLDYLELPRYDGAQKIIN